MKFMALLVCLTLLSAAVISTAGCGTGDTALGDTTLPVITNLSVTDITETTATITWITDEPATSVLSHTSAVTSAIPMYLASPGIIVGVQEDSKLVTVHRIVAKNFLPGTTYNCWVTSTDASGNESESVSFSITTLGTRSLPPVYVYQVLL